jgi:hypothetical protein
MFLLISLLKPFWYKRKKYFMQTVHSLRHYGKKEFKDKKGREK